MRRVIKKLFFVLGGIIVLSNVFSRTVFSKDSEIHWNGYTFMIWGLSCWDAGNHIDWKYTDDNYYSNIVEACDEWNSIIKTVSAGRLKTAFRKDTSKTVCDIKICDYRKKDGSNAYININWFTSYGVVKLNKYYMEDLKYWERTAVVMHELGHAMGISDNNYVDSIMYFETPKVSKPQARDKAALEYVMRQYTTIY